VELLCSYFHGKGGNAPSQGNLKEAKTIRGAYEKALSLKASGKPEPKKSIFTAIISVYQAARGVTLTGDPDTDWLAVRGILQKGSCSRLNEIANEVRNVRLLERGTQLSSAFRISSSET
jgi:DNA helicase II / ATP-dependent DNA helicase PcrA